MKQFILFFIGLGLSLQGCALLPVQLSLAKDHKASHKQQKTSEHKAARQLHKEDKTHPSLKERITLVDFKLFDKDQHKSKKHHKHQESPATTGNVVAYFYPVGPELIEIPGQGITLQSFLEEHELEIAILTTQAFIRKKVEEAVASKVTAEEKAETAAKTEQEENEKITSSLDLRPDVIILQQGPVSTVFPREMLGLPQIANINVVPNDSVITQDVIKQGLNQKDAESGEHNLLSNTIDLDENLKAIEKQYSLSGFTKQSDTLLTKPGKRHINTITPLSQEFNENAPAVIVVYRTFRGQLVRIIIPNNAYGILKQPTDESSPEGKRWKRNFDDFSNLAIREGDVIEFTTLDLLDLTSH